MKTLFLTHNDLDACGSIIVANLFSLKIDEFKFCNYDDLYDENNDKVILRLADETYDRIFVVDIGCNKNMYDYLTSKTGTLGIFDHHKMTKEIETESGIYFDLKASGTEIFYDALKSSSENGVPEKWNQFVKIVSAYDLWLLDSPFRSTAEDLNRVYFGVLNYGSKGTYNMYRFFIESQVQKLLDKNLEEFYFTEWEHQKIANAKEKEYKEYTSAVSNMQKKVDNNGIMYIIYHGSSKISHVCSELLKNNKDVQYVLNFNTYTGSRKKRITGKVSARSRVGFDVTTLNGIHGHVEAGGGSFKEALLKRIWYYANVHLNYKEEI